MPHFLVDVHEITHTCPADPEPHAIDTRRRIVAATYTGPCLSPVPVRVAGREVPVACGRRLRRDEQCDNCRPVIEIRNRTSTHIGHTGPMPERVRGGGK